MPTSLSTPQTLPLGYTQAATLGPIQNLEKIVWQNTGGVVVFQVGRLDATGKVVFDQTEAVLPPGIWGMDNIYGIRFRSRDAASLATLDPCTGYFQDDPDPFNPGNIPGTTTAITGAVNVQHNTALVGSQPTLDFEDGGGIVWAPTNDGVNTRVKIGGTVTGFVAVSTTGSGASPLFQTNLTGDTQERYSLGLDGTMEWGPGNAAQDVTLGRNSPGALFLLNPAAGGLSTFFADTFWGGAIHSTHTTDPAFQASLSTDTNPRYQVNTDGTTQWGAGGVSAFDTEIQRTAAGVLGAVSTAISTGPTAVNAFSINGTIIGAGDNFISTIRSSGTVGAWATAVNGDTQYRHIVTSSGQLQWGTGAAAADITLSRVVLNTVTSLQVTAGQGISNGGTPNNLTTTGWAVWSSVMTMIGSAAGNNTYLGGIQNEATYRWRITTDGMFSIGGGAVATDVTMARVVNGPSGTGNFWEMILGSGFGYGTGTGGTATIATGSSGTINKPTGKVTASAAVATGGAGSYTVTNSVVGTDDVVIVNIVIGGGNQQRVFAKVQAGSFTIDYENNSGVNQTPVFTFAVIKGAVS